MKIPAILYKPFGMSYSERQEALARCTSQSTRVMFIFNDKKRPMTPYEVYQIYIHLWPKFICKEGSIRRAMTTLTDNKLLVMTGYQEPGGWGAMNHKWRLAD